MDGVVGIGDELFAGKGGTLPAVAQPAPQAAACNGAFPVEGMAPGSDAAAAAVALYKAAAPAVQAAAGVYGTHNDFPPHIQNTAHGYVIICIIADACGQGNHESARQDTKR